jgi:hypothetical protein
MSQLNDLMSLDPISLSKSKSDRVKLIAYYRRMRSNAAVGLRPKRKSEGEAIPAKQLLDIVGVEKQGDVKNFKRRF